MSAIATIKLAALYTDPKEASAISLRGLIHQEMKNYPEAIADFNKAIEVDPKYTWAITQRGITYQKMKNYEKALEDLSQLPQITIPGQSSSKVKLI